MQGFCCCRRVCRLAPAPCLSGTVSALRQSSSLSRFRLTHQSPQGVRLACACSLPFGYGFGSATKLLAFPLSPHTPKPSRRSLGLCLLLAFRVRFRLCDKAPRFPAFASHTKALKAFARLVPAPCLSGTVLCSPPALRSRLHTSHTKTLKAFAWLVPAPCLSGYLPPTQTVQSHISQGRVRQKFLIFQ